MKRTGLAISAKGLVKHYDAGRAKALDGLSIDVVQGAMIALVGPSGSGKSTLLYALAGLVDPDMGTIEIEERQPVGEADWTRLRASTIGLVFQESWLLPTLTAAQNIELPMVGVEPSARVRAHRVEELLETVGMSGFARRMPDSLSGGERQRIAVARSLANRPRILLADEPTGELDSANSGRIMEMMARLRAERGVTMLIVTHDPQTAAYCDRRYQVVDGTGTYVD
jgi:putative ABC transport system ATP-binding protein